FAAAHQATRDGATAHWTAVFTDERDASSLISNPDSVTAGSFVVQIDPRGRLQRFATGASSAPNIEALDNNRAVSLGLDLVRHEFAIDPVAYEFESVARKSPAGVIEMSWTNPLRRYGHVEVIRVNFQGDKILKAERLFGKPPGFTER